MDRMLLPIFGSLFLFLAGFSACFVWDHHPHVDCCRLTLGFWHPGFDFPKSLAEQRDDAVAAEAGDAAQARGWETALLQTQRNLAACNGSVDLLKADSDRKVAAAEAQVRAEQKAAKDALDSVNALMTYQPKGVTACDRASDMQAWIKRDLAR